MPAEEKYGGGGGGDEHKEDYRTYKDSYDEDYLGYEEGDGYDDDFHSDEEGLCGPLKLLQKHFVAGAGSRESLLTVNADQVEADTLDEDVVHLGIHENVVNV